MEKEEQINTSSTSIPTAIMDTGSITPAQFGAMINLNVSKLAGNAYPKIYDQIQPNQ